MFRKFSVILLPALAMLLFACPRPRPELRPTPGISQEMSWRVAGAHLDDIFEKIPKGSIRDAQTEISEKEKLRIHKSHGEQGVKFGNAHIYGEMLDYSVFKALSWVKVNSNDVIYDLGSGRGRFLMLALMATPAREAVGVELARSRVQVAKQAQTLLYEEKLIPEGKTLAFYEEDMTKANIDDATIIFMDCVLFSDEMMNTMTNRMANLKNLRWVITITKGLPKNPHFEHAHSELMPVSWSPNHGSTIQFFKHLL